GLEDRAPERDRPAREAADLAEDAHRGHRVLARDSLEPVGPPGEDVPVVVDDALVRGDPADLAVRERLHQLAERARRPERVAVDEHRDGAGGALWRLGDSA